MKNHFADGVAEGKILTNEGNYWKLFKIAPIPVKIATVVFVLYTIGNVALLGDGGISSKDFMGILIPFLCARGALTGDVWVRRLVCVATVVLLVLGIYGVYSGHSSGGYELLVTGIGALVLNLPLVIIPLYLPSARLWANEQRSRKGKKASNW